MRWKKLGKIFDPTKFNLPNNCFEYAQSPQALIFDNFIRIYFSSRERDNVGKYLSHILFADFDKDFKKVMNISKEEVIPLGELGCFDEHGIFPMNVVRNGDKVLAYTTGWNRKVSVSADASIGFAFSEDNGLHFRKLGSGPVMTASLTEPFLVSDAFVSIFEGVFHMWYIYGTKWIHDPKDGTAQRVYKIAYAFSDDGINWKRDSKLIISDSLNENECQALPTVIHFRNKYHMYFCYREATGFREKKERAYRIGYAYSEDLRNWTRDDTIVGIHTSENNWDSEMLCYPNVFHFDGNIYMLYNGNEFGRYGFGLAILEH
jgi:hypothetical protein